MNNNSKSPAPPQRTLTLRGVAAKAIQRPKAAPIAQVKPAAPAPRRDDVPADALLSYCCWRVGFRRPTYRYLSRETALAEALRLREENPGAIVHTYRLELITEDAP